MLNFRQDHAMTREEANARRLLAPALQAPLDIEEKHQQLGGDTGLLGRSISDLAECPDGHGFFVHFQGGSIYWTGNTGAHEVHGDIRGKWASMGWERSFLGYPISDEHDSNGGRISDFQNGSIFWTAASGPQVRGAFVTITYEQVGACNGYPQDTGGAPHHVVTTGPNAAYVAFKVLSIDNSHDTDFNFDPNRCFINQAPREFVNTGLSFAQDLGVFAAIPTTVPGGKIEGNGGIMVAVVRTVAANGASEANNTNYFLLYDTAEDDPMVFLAKRNADQANFPQTDSCLAIRF